MNSTTITPVQLVTNTLTRVGIATVHNNASTVTDFYATLEIVTRAANLLRRDIENHVANNPGLDYASDYADAIETLRTLGETLPRHGDKIIAVPHTR